LEDSSLRKNVEETYTLTIYELDPQTTLEEYKEILETRISTQKDKEYRDSEIIPYNEDVRLSYFSYVKCTEKHDITWHRKWKDLFSVDKALRVDSLTGHGIIIINDIRHNKLFALVFGRSYHLLKEFYIRDFGIKMATRLFDGKAVGSISAKYFSVIKNKQIIDYKDDYTLQSDEGQAVDYLNARIVEDYERRPNPSDQYIDKFLLYVRADAAAGYSYIRITLSAERITLNILLDTILLIPFIEIYEERFPLPAMSPVPKPIGDKLDLYLLESLKNDMQDFFIGIPFFGFDESDKFSFFDNIEKYTLSYGSFSIEHEGNLAKKDVVDFIKSQDQIVDIKKIIVTVWIEGQQRPPASILKWLDVELLYEDKNYALYNGSWVQFNETYKEYLNQSVQKYENDFLIPSLPFSFSKQEFEQFKKTHTEELLTAFCIDGNGSIDKVYREFVYNYILSQKSNWLLFDRVIDESIEVCDINIANDSFVHVKIGDAASFEIVLHQSLYGVRYLDSNPSRYSVIRNKNNELLTHASKAVVIYLSTGTSFTKISAMKSLKCKMAFIDWVVFMTEHDMKPLIIQAFFTSENKQEKVLWDRLESLEVALD